MIEFKQIKVEDTYILRQQTLRPWQRVDEMSFDCDKADGVIHLGAFVEDKLVGIITVLPAINDNFPDAIQYQAKFIGVDEKYRNQHIASGLLATAENVAFNRKATLMWLNSRDYAQGLYVANGYTAIGEFFMIPNVCNHILMYKEIK